jgi:hypothetical protein
MLRLISTNEITMLKDMNNLIHINLSGKFKYFYIPNMEIRGILNFIQRLDTEAIYTLIPVISMLAKDNDPHIILSKQILVTNNSSSKLIYNFLSLKLEQAIIDFGLTNVENGNYFQLIFILC